MNLDSLSSEQILNLLPHKMQVRFALKCANDVRHILKDERSTKALDIIALWLEDKATTEEVRVAYTAANAASYADAAAAAAAANAATITKKDYKLELIEMINNLNKLEKALYLD